MRKYVLVIAGVVIVFALAIILLIVGGNKANSKAILISATPQTVSRGQLVTISWNSKNPPINSYIVLTLSGPKGQIGGIISEDLPASGSYTWQVPEALAWHISDTSVVQVTPPGTYQISAQLYTPRAGIGDGMRPPSPQLKYISSSQGPTLTITK